MTCIGHLFFSRRTAVASDKKKKKKKTRRKTNRTPQTCPGECSSCCPLRPRHLRLAFVCCCGGHQQVGCWRLSSVVRTRVETYTQREREKGCSCAHYPDSAVAMLPFLLPCFRRNVRLHKHPCYQSIQRILEPRGYGAGAKEMCRAIIACRSRSQTTNQKREDKLVSNL